MKVIVKHGETVKSIKLVGKHGNIHTISVDDKIYELDILKSNGYKYSVIHAGRCFSMEPLKGGSPNVITVNSGGHNYEMILQKGVSISESGCKKPRHNLQVKAPMPGKIVKVKILPGDEVEAGTPLVTLSAMKMENDIKSSSAGVVHKIEVSEDEIVREGQLLVEIKPNGLHN